MTPPIVVLDFDGVMNDLAFLRVVNDRYTATQIYASPELHLDPVRVARVQRVCDATGAEVVLVTAWQASFSPRQLKTILQCAGLTAKVRRTVHGLKMGGDCRADCTRAYLANVGATRFVVLDDTISLWCARRREPRTPVPEGHVEVMRREGEHLAAYFVPPWLVGRLVSPLDGLTDADTDAAIAALAIDRRVTR